MGNAAGKTKMTVEEQFESFIAKNLITGFKNQFNTCYCATVLQSLNGVPQFREKVLNEKIPNSLVYKELNILFQKLNNNKKPFEGIYLNRFMKQVASKNEWFEGENHHDCLEFQNWLLNDMNDSILDLQKKKGIIKEEDKSPVKRDKKKYTWLEKIFQGVITTSIICGKCDSKTVTKEPFLELPVDLSANISQKSSIRETFKEELMEGDDQFFCDKCNCKTDSVKRVELQSLPECLIIQLKRFKYDEQRSRMAKINQMVPFSAELKLFDQETGEVEYRLTSIIVHIGAGINYGHYIVLLWKEGHWFNIDDDKINIFNERDQLTIYGGPVSPACAYIQFYQRV